MSLEAEESPALLKHPLMWLLVLTGLAFIRLLWVDFSWDDESLIQSNPFLSSLEPGFGLFFTQDLWESCVRQAQVESGYYRPLVMISWTLEHALFCGVDGSHIHSLVPQEQWTEACVDLYGGSTLAIPPVDTGAWSAAAHLISIGWHLLATGLLFVLLRRMFQPGPALVGTALFALHPVQSEVLALVAARNDSMAAAFLLAALCLLEPRTRPRAPRLLAGGSLFLLALLSKESALLAPLFLVILDLGRWKKPGHWSRYLSMLLPVLIYLWLRSFANLEGSAWPTDAAQDKVLEKLNLIAGMYARLLVWPWPLSPARSVDYLPAPGTLIPAVLVLGALGVLAFRKSQTPWLVLTGFVWALLALAPSMAATLDKGLLGERYLYLPMTGLGLALAASLQHLPRLPLALLGGLAIVLIQVRLPQWQNGRTVWMAAHESSPTPYTAGGLAWYLHRDGTRMGQDGTLAEADLQASLPLLEQALIGTTEWSDAGWPAYRKACPLVIKAHLEAEDWQGAARLGKLIWEDQLCPQMGTSLLRQYGEGLLSIGEWSSSLDLLLAAEAIDMVRAISIDEAAAGRPVFIIHSSGRAGNSSAYAWENALRNTGVSRVERLDLGAGFDKDRAVLQAIEQEDPGLILLGTLPMHTRDLVRAAHQAGLAQGRSWLSLPGRVQPRDHARIENYETMAQIAAALMGLGESDAVDALVRASEDPEALRVEMVDLLKRSQSDLQCGAELLVRLESEESSAVITHIYELLQSGECSFRGPVLEIAARAQARDGNWQGALMSSMGSALMRSMDALPGGLESVRDQRAVLIHRPDSLVPLWTTLWKATQQEQGLIGLGQLAWQDENLEAQISALRAASPDLIVLALLPQDAAQLRVLIQSALPGRRIIEIPAVSAPGQRHRPMDEPALVTLGAWMRAKGLEKDSVQLAAQTQAPVAFLHAMEGLLLESQR